MDFIWNLLEKMLTSLVISVLIFVISFSYLTGRFPPRKDDMVRAFSLAKEIVVSQKDYNKKATEIQMIGASMSLEQLADFQRLSLRRTELGLEMLKIFEKIKFTAVEPELEQKLRRITEHMTQAEKELGEITEHLEKSHQ